VFFHSEDQFVGWLRRRWPERAAGLSLGIGDDAAIIRPRRGHDLVLTTDLSIETVHFRLDLHPPQAIGHRALARSLSDLAAMGAKPRYALLSLAFPRAAKRSWITAFYDGMDQLAARFGLTLIGGDTAVTGEAPVTADVIAVGEIKRGQALRRQGAKPGDLIYVTGRLGMAALGLSLLKAGSPERKAGAMPGSQNIARAALAAHLYPEPRCAVGQYLAKYRLASAAIDVSDGFARDLGRLCESSRCGARIWQDRLTPVVLIAGGAPRYDSLCIGLRSDSLHPLDLALHGGEDYELLFTVPRSKAARVPRSIAGIKLHRIGEITAERRLRLRAPDNQELALEPQGYDHFQERN
jgi:thiamine-monophosphate kinase